MPKIPTFAARGRPTAEVGSIKTNLKLKGLDFSGPFFYDHIKWIKIKIKLTTNKKNSFEN